MQTDLNFYKKSGKHARHFQALKKFTHYEEFSYNKLELKKIFQNDKKDSILPKPGEFFLVTTKQKHSIGEKDNRFISFDDIEEKNGLSASKNNKGRRSRSTIHNRGLSREKESELNNLFDNDDNNAEEEFDVEKDQILFTRDISMILDKQKQGYLAPSSEFLYNLKNRQGSANKQNVSGNKSFLNQTVNNSRPISSKLFSKKFEKTQQTMESIDILGNVKRDHSNDSTRKMSYTVKSGKKMFGGISGHRAVTLKQIETAHREETKKSQVFDSKLNPHCMDYNKELNETINKHLKEQQMILAKENQAEEPKINFFSLDYFIYPDVDGDPKEMIQKYKAHGSEKVYGYSKFFDPKGDFHWKRCEVIGYDEKEVMFEIRWLDNLALKFVTRSNLRFEKENKKILRKCSAKQEFGEIDVKFFLNIII